MRSLWKWKSLSHGPLLATPWTSPCNSLGQTTGVGRFSLLQGIFPTQGLNLGLLHCKQILYQLSHKWSPRVLEWVACPFSSGSSRLRNQTGVSCIADGFFTNWAIRDALDEPNSCLTRLSSVCYIQSVIYTVAGMSLSFLKQPVASFHYI